MKNEFDLESIANSWVRIFNQLSYCGKRKEEIYNGLDSIFGQENWLPAHFFNGRIISRDRAYEIYEEAYYQFLKNNPSVQEKLVKTANEVYDIAISNIDSGLDYEAQECDATHLQDIAIRRALTRLTLEEQKVSFDLKNLPKIKIFNGNHPVQIRDHTTDGYYLNPGKVPFHKPELILKTEQKGWWDAGTVEDWYQKNKVLLVNPERFFVKLVMCSPSFLFFNLDRYNYYCAERHQKKLPLDLYRVAGKKAKEMYSTDKDFIEVTDSPELPYSEWIKYNPKINLNNKRRISCNEVISW